METVRAVILAIPARDERPWSSAGATPKPLVPVATRPILFHALDALRAVGVGEAVILTHPLAAAAFRAAVGDGSRWDMRISYRARAAPPGVADALGLAGMSVADGPVVVHRADALLRRGLRGPLDGFTEHGLDALALMLAPERAPAAGGRRTAGYLLSPRGAAILRGGAAGPDPLTRLRARGGRVRRLDVEGCLACAGDEAALLEANRQALLRVRTAVTDATLDGCEIQGEVVIHPTATLRGTLVRGPVMIGAGARLVDSYVGPYTSIGADTQIEGTEIEHSIVMDGARLLFVGRRLETSIIGRGASIVRRFDIPNAVRLSVGDGAEVALS